MRPSSSILVILSLTASLAHTPRAIAAPECADVFSDQSFSSESAAEVSQRLYDEMTALERKIAGWQKFNGKYERTIVVSMRHRRSQLISLLAVGEVSGAADLYREFFRSYDFAFEKYKTGDRSPETIRRLGENYGEYLYVRKLLETSAELAENETIKKTSQGVLHYLEPAKIAEMFDGIGYPTERASIAEIEDAFARDPKMLIAKLKRDLVAERQLGFKTFALGVLHIQNVQKAIYTLLPTGIRQPVTALIGLSYNSYVISKYLPDIERILLMPDNVELRAENLREMNAKYPAGDELLVTLVRMPQLTATWDAVKAQIAEKAKTSTVYASFLERMTTAEATAVKLKDLPRFDQASLIDRISGAIIPIGALAAFVVQHPSLQAPIDGVAQLIKLIQP